MAFELKQSMKLVQQLVMTPQLQQAIKLLQLSQLELVNLATQELQENPFLPQKRQGWFALYTIASIIYRWVIVFSIMMFLMKFVIGRIKMTKGASSSFDRRLYSGRAMRVMFITF